MRAFIRVIALVGVTVIAVLGISGCGSQKPIANSEKTSTEGEAFGYRFRAESGKNYPNMNIGNDKQRVQGVECFITADPIDPSNKQGDPIELRWRLSRSDKGVSPYNESMSSTVIKQGEPLSFGFVTDFGTPIPFDRYEVELNPRRFRTYSEPIVLKNVTITPIKIRAYKEGESKSHEEIRYRTSFQGPQKFVTPSGLTLTFTQVNSNSNVLFADIIVCVKVEPGLSNLNLDKSPLCSQTKKPVSISFQYTANATHQGVGTCRVSTMDRNAEYLNIRSSEVLPTKPLLIPELKLQVVQKAILEEKTIKLIVPVKKTETQTSSTR